MKKRFISILCQILSAALLISLVPSLSVGAEFSLDSLKNTPPVLSAGGLSLVMPSVSGATISLFGSSHTQIVDLDGNVHTPLVDTEVQLIYKAALTDGSVVEADYNVSIIIEGENRPSDDAPAVIPALREWAGSDGEFSFTSDSRFIFDTKDSELSKKAEILADYYEDMGYAVKKTNDTTPQEGDIVFTVDSSLSYLGEEGYALDIGEYAEIKSSSYTGLFYGGISILQMLSASEDGTISQGKAHDYPAYEVRSGMIDIGRMWIPMDYLYDVSRYMAYYKMNEVHLHINDNTYGGGSEFRLESDVEGLTSKKFYTKNEYRQYQKDMLDIGLVVLTEIDTPAHAGSFNGIDGVKMLDGTHIDIDDEATVQFIKDLFDEYITGDDPVFVNKIVHIGTDEYPLSHKESMRSYIDGLLKHVSSRGYTPRFWGGFSKSGKGFDGTTPVMTDGAQTDYWTTVYSDFDVLFDMGYDVVNMAQSVFYIVPGGNYGFHDFLPTKTIYDNWQGNYFDMTGTLSVPEGHPQAIGISFGLWNDLQGAHLGYSKYEIMHRLKDAVLLISEKGWCGSQTEDIGAEDFLQRVEKLGDYAPLANPLATYTGDSTYDKSLGIEAVGYPYKVSFDVKIDDLSGGGTLFESSAGKIYYDADGTLKADYEDDRYKFDFVLPQGKSVNLTFSSDKKKSVLIVDNAYYYFPKNTLNSTKDKASTAMVFPLGTVSDAVGEITIEKASVSLESGKVKENLALGAATSVSGLEVDDGRFGSELAVDGEISQSSRLSFARDKDEQWLVIDLGEKKKFNSINIHFFEHVSEYKIYVSDTGENGDWTEVYHLTDGVTREKITDEITLEETSARYIKYVQLKRNLITEYNTYYSGGIMEFEVYNTDVEKYSKLIEQAEELMAEHPDRDSTELKKVVKALESYLADLDSAYYSHLDALYSDVENAMSAFIDVDDTNNPGTGSTPSGSDTSSAGSSASTSTPGDNAVRIGVISAVGIIVAAAAVLLVLGRRRRKFEK